MREHFWEVLEFHLNTFYLYKNILYSPETLGFFQFRKLCQKLFFYVFRLSLSKKYLSNDNDFMTNSFYVLLEEHWIGRVLQKWFHVVYCSNGSEECQKHVQESLEMIRRFCSFSEKTGKLSVAAWKVVSKHMWGIKFCMLLKSLCWFCQKKVEMR